MTDSKETAPWDANEFYKDVTVAEEYDKVRFSSIPGKIFDALERSSVRRALKGISPGSSVIDIPCGTGRMTGLLLELGFSVVAADISPAMLEVCRRKHPNQDRLVFQIVDARNAKKLGRTFDAAVCARVLMHFPVTQQIEFLKGIAEITDGTVIFTQSYSTPYQRLRRRLKKLLGNKPPANYPITEVELRHILKSSGLRERKRTRAMPLISESIVVVAERDG